MSKIVSEEKLYFAALIVNAVIFVSEIIGFVFAAFELGPGLFTYYTEDSNILLCLSSFFVLLTGYFNIRKGCGTNFPTHLFRLIATSASTLTMLVVLFVLIPIVGNPVKMLLSGSMFFHHTFCPLLSLISFLFLEKEESRHLKIKHTLFAMIFTALYGIVFIVLNIARVFRGPYPFLLVYDQPVWASVLWFICIFGLAYLIDFLLYFGNRKIFDRGVIHG